MSSTFTIYINIKRALLLSNGAPTSPCWSNSGWNITRIIIHSSTNTEVIVIISFHCIIMMLFKLFVHTNLFFFFFSSIWLDLVWTEKHSRLTPYLPGCGLPVETPPPHLLSGAFWLADRTTGRRWRPVNQNSCQSQRVQMCPLYHDHMTDHMTAAL